MSSRPVARKSKVHQIVIVIALIFTSITIPRYVIRLAFGLDLDVGHVSLIGLCIAMMFHSALGIPDLSCTLGILPNKGSSLKVTSVLNGSESKKPSAQPTETADNHKPPIEKPNPYIKDMDPLIERFLNLVDLEKEPVGPSYDPNVLWHSVARQDHKTFSVDVHKRVNHDFFFRIIADLDSSPEEVYDFMADISRRNEWDEICEAGGVVETVSRCTRIQFMRTRGMWPTASRDALVVGFFKKLENGCLINVTKSIDSHPDYTSISGDVRMTANLAGFMVEPHPSGDSKRCRLYQIMDGDLNGWLPKQIVSLLTTQAFPYSMKKANKIFRGISEPRSVSKYIEIAEGKGESPEQDTSLTSSSSYKEEKKRTTVVNPASKLKVVLKILEKYQPVLVAITLFLILFRRR